MRCTESPCFFYRALYIYIYTFCQQCCYFRTAMGRARAWLRLALMQKRLADYLRILLEHREETLEEYFEPHALMLNEEAVIITGLLVGLNVVDCNLCVKVP